MMSSNTETSVMDQILDRTIEQNPHASELLKAFGPIIARQRQLTASIDLPKLDYSSIDKEKLKFSTQVNNLRDDNIHHKSQYQKR